MPRLQANNLAINYEQQGTGEPLLLIPYLAADHACYAFQVPEYAKHFTCVSLDLPGTGESDRRDGVYTTEVLADDVAAFMQAAGITRAHVSGLSLGGAVGLWLAAKYPEKVQSLSVHSGWARTDEYVRTVIEGWRLMSGAAGVHETIIRGMFPWCLTAELYATRPDYVESLAAFVRSRPAQSVAEFLQQTSAVLTHNAEAQLSRITAPTQITFGGRDQLTSTRFARTLMNIPKAELHVFDDASHAPIYEYVEGFNQTTLAFLQRAVGAAV